MNLTIYQIDVFSDKLFSGNPAAVIPLEQWLPDHAMQAIAEENNLSETVFFVPVDEHFHIRWFTPNKEVKLCGHATLASAFVLFELLGYKKEQIIFDSLSGPLIVTSQNGVLTMDFPAQVPVRCDVPEALVNGLGAMPFECYKNEDYFVVFDNEDDVLNIKPEHRYLEQLDLRGVIVTAPSVKQDFVARFFAPKFGIPEDPVTGSAYTQLTPYWSKRTGKTKLSARQVSQRGGQVFCELKGKRVFISGRAVKYMEGVIEI